MLRWDVRKSRTSRPRVTPRPEIIMANQILIQPQDGELLRGRPVTVPILVVLDRPLKVRGIHAKFHGAEETKATYTTTTTDSKGNTTTHTHTAVQHVDITTQAHLISGNERLGFFGNLSDGIATIFGGGSHDVMQPGEYPFEVEVSIPASAPGTHVGKKTRVFYELSMQIDVPVAFDLKAVHGFTVRPEDTHRPSEPVRTRYPDDADRGFFDSILEPDLRIEMAIAGNVVRVGEPISGIFCLESPKPLKCNGVRVRLLGIEHSKANGHTDRHVHRGEPIELDTPGVIAGPYKKEFEFTAATSGPLSANGELFSIEWFVQVELDVPWAKDPRVRAPLTLLPAQTAST